jgi:hypothetical protein
MRSLVVCLFVCLFVVLLYRQQLSLDWRLIEREEEEEGMKLMMRNEQPLSSWHIFLTSFVLRRSGILFTDSLASPLVVVVVSNLACLVKLEVTDPKRKGKRLCR